MPCLPFFFHIIIICIYMYMYVYVHYALVIFNFYLMGYLQLPKELQLTDLSRTVCVIQCQVEHAHLTRACTVLAQRVGEGPITTIGWRQVQ